MKSRTDPARYSASLSGRVVGMADDMRYPAICGERRTEYVRAITLTSKYLRGIVESNRLEVEGMSTGRLSKGRHIEALDAGTRIRNGAAHEDRHQRCGHRRSDARVLAARAGHEVCSSKSRRHFAAAAMPSTSGGRLRHCREDGTAPPNQRDGLPGEGGALSSTGMAARAAASRSTSSAA